MGKNRITEWRHRTGRSKKRRPHGEIDYKGVAIAISKRFFKDLWTNYKEDLLQEIELLVLDATVKKRIAGRKKVYGNSKDRMGLVLFSRATQARFHQMRRAYGLYRNKKFWSLIENIDNEKGEATWT